MLIFEHLTFQSVYDIDPGYLDSQTLMSTILLPGSIIGLALTLLCLLPAKPLRKPRSAKINICFTFALLVASFFFLLQNVLAKDDDSGPIKMVHEILPL